MCTTLPEVLVTVMGIEKVVPSFRDLEVMLQLLPRSSTGERMNPYTSIWAGVHAGDGPRAFHLVLLDAGRTRAARDEVGRDALRCIRCSACINVCPVHRQTGGHAYHTPYAGPIGAILQPQFDGERGASSSLPFASTLCGACRTSVPCGSTSPDCSCTSARRSSPQSGSTAEAASLKLLGRAFRSRAGLRAGAATRPRSSRSRSRATVGSAASRLGRCGAWGRSRDLPARAAADVPRVVGVP